MGDNLDKLNNILDHEESIINEFKHLLDREGKDILKTLELIRYVKLASISILNSIKNFETLVNSAKNSRHWGGKNPNYSIREIEGRKKQILGQINDVDKTIRRIVAQQNREIKLDKYCEKFLKNAKKTLNRVDYSLLKKP